MKSWGLAAGFVVLWSSGFIGAELGTEAAPAVTLLAWRALVAAAVLVAWRSLRPRRRGEWLGRVGRPRLDRGDIGWVGVVGLLSQAGFLAGVVFAVELGVPPGTVALIAALQPLAASIAAQPVLGERATGRQWAGLLVGLAGVALVVSGDMTAAEAAPMWAYALPFAAMSSLVAGTLVERRTQVNVDVVDSVTVQSVVAALVFVPLAGGVGSLAPPVDPVFWVAVVWTVVLSHLGGYVFYWLNLRRGGVARLGALLYLTPGATTVWALAMFGQAVTTLVIIGMFVCLVSLALVFSSRGAAESTGSAKSAAVSTVRCGTLSN